MHVCVVEGWVGMHVSPLSACLLQSEADQYVQRTHCVFLLSVQAKFPTPEKGLQDVKGEDTLTNYMSSVFKMNENQRSLTYEKSNMGKKNNKQKFVP